MMDEDLKYNDLDKDTIELLRKFEKMLENNSFSYVDFDDCLIILDCYIYLGKLDLLKIATDYFVYLYPEREVLKDYYVKLSFLQGDYPKVISLINADTVRDPMLLAILAESYVNCLCADEAMRAFEFYLVKEKDCDNLQQAFSKIAAVFNEHDFPDYALFFLNIGKRFFPDDNEINFEFARCYYLKRNLKKSRSILDNILKKERNYYDALKLYATVCFDMHLFDEAISVMDDCLEQNPSDTDVVINKARALHNVSRIEESVDFLEKFNDSHPDIEIVQSDLADLYICVGKENEALGLYKTLVKKHPRNIKYISTLGILFFNCSEHKKAIPYLKKSFEDNPSDVVAMCLAISFFKEKDVDNSYKYLKIAAEYNRKLENEFYSIFPAAKRLFNKRHL